MSFAQTVFYYFFRCGMMTLFEAESGRMAIHTVNAKHLWYKESMKKEKDITRRIKMARHYKIVLLSLICFIFLSACSANPDTGTEVAPVPMENTGSDSKPSEDTATEEIPESGSRSETVQALENYEGEYTGNTISDPAYDGLEIQKNADDTYAIQVEIPFLTKLYECTGFQTENIILFSTSEWGEDKKVEGRISFDEDSATVTFTSGWYRTATAENSYQYHKTSDNPHLESSPDERPDYCSFPGEYCDDNGDTGLEIHLNGDGTYLIQISLFREIGYDACIGSLSEEKMSFTSDERGGVSGSITLDNDLAVVRFDPVGYFENAKVKTYLFRKISDDLNIDYETLGIQKQEYPSEFSMGENLKTAITQLALSYDNFGKAVVNSESWKEIFIARFIQNSRASFDYLDRISDENGGKISVDQLNYIQYSLTDTEVDFSSEAGDPVNRYDAASSFNYGWISGYSYEETKDGVIVTADFEVGYDGTDSTQKRKIIVELVKNPYSCFDGYSVIAISSDTGNSDLEHQN